MKYKVGIIGLGFVGSACEVGFSQVKDCEVIGYDKYKPSNSLATVVDESNILFLCLPTPMNEDGSCNTSIIEEVCEKINKLAKKSKTIVVKSTVPPGTTQKFSEKYKNHLFVFNPEFLTEANFIQDFLNQDRIILGYCNDCLPDKDSFADFLESFYCDFTKTQKNPAKIYITRSQEAEMLKNATNAFLAVKIAFCNEIYEICKQINIDYDSVVDLLKLDKRIGTSHMKVPGPDGQFMFGGKCIPKDLNSLINVARQLGVEPLVLDTVWSKNLLLRQNYDWEQIPGATNKTGFKKK